jgi:DNA-binding IclR family transcriptional regulator
VSTVRSDQQQSQRHLTDRVFGILDAFTPQEPRLTVSDISRRTLLPVATVHRLVRQLANWGALDRGDDGRYGIGLHLCEIARLEHHGLRLRSAALPRMSRLQEATGSTVLLCVLHRDDVVVIEQVTSGADLGLPARQVARSTPAGRLLLEHRAGCTAGVAAGLRRRSGILRSGLALGGTQAGRGPFWVAAPVVDASKTVVAALSTIGLSPGHDRIDVARAVQREAATISTALEQHTSVVIAG